jgi:hypothetical protein
VTITREHLERAASETGFSVDALEKVGVLVRLLDLIGAHPFLGPRLALKGGTALNLFLFELPRLSVDIDVNYIGRPERETMIAERPQLEAALSQVASRLGLSVKRAPDDHAGGKWRLGYTSALGRPAIVEVDVNYMLRVPLWEATPQDSPEFLGDRAKRLRVLDAHELAAGKLAALIARRASRDLFDARELLSRGTLERDRLRVAFVVYGGINRTDWRTVSASAVDVTAEEVRTQLVPTLRRDMRPEANAVARWAAALVEETRALLGAVLPLNESERLFLDRLNGEGVIDASLLTSDPALQARILDNPGLQWKALNVRRHRGPSR